MGKGIYFAYAIDQTTGRPALLNQAQSWCSKSSLVSWSYDPGRAFFAGTSVDRSPAIRNINREALDNADVVVAFLPTGTVSVGVPMEIDRAIHLGKYVLVISDAPSWMLQFDLETESNAACFLQWGGEAQEWLVAALRGPSRALVAPERTALPTTVAQGAEEPRRGYEDDAGLDLTVSETLVINPGEFVDVPCGVAVELPDWSWGLITGRSSTLRKRGLMVNPGVIDAGYRGELFAGVFNLTDAPVKVEQGERLAQIVVMVNGTRLVEVERVEKLSPGSRELAGFGSTGA